MSLRQLPRVNALSRPACYAGEATDTAYSQWADVPMALAVTDDNVIEINDVIGEDWWTGGGFTSNRFSAALRAIGPRDVTLFVNSPGGDMFEGLAIYNMAVAHPGKVTVQVMGMAASAASVIAMAADELVMAQGSFLMVHNAWGGIVGNRHDMAAAIDVFTKFDSAMADIYAARTGQPAAAMTAMMDGPTRNSDGTWLTAQEAVDQKFADRLGDAAEALITARAEPDHKVWAVRRVEAALMKQGLPRSERRSLLRELSGTSGAAAHTAMPGAGDPEVMAALARLNTTLSV